ncbi:MAG: pyridoxal phosphate-dependent aminotransferase [Candidatus Omnitrophica bacterium]|nr:pyridoxal phosphate-dependent aminotransferase [Candidatus Omnitrophota bacterium]HOX54745.1 pyridoxal phosphate-dependent aminotransferase [Candidatus Omnitrophota bacterium]
MNLARRVKDVLDSPTLALTSKVKQLKKEGFDVINFTAGEPDFDTPKEIKQAAIDAINKGFTKYTPSAGTQELKEAICEKFKRDNSLDYSPNQVIVSCGAKHSLFNIVEALIERDDEVIIPSPFWVSYPEMAKLVEAKTVFLETEPLNNFKIDLKKFEKAITKKTKAFILNSPSNPTGSVYSRQELEKIAEICVANKIFVISDEIYEKLIYDNQKHVSIASFGKDIYDLTITVNGMSKAFSMTGWRIGYLGAPQEIASAVKRIQDHSTSNPASISQAAALAALKMPEDQVIKMREEFEKRRNYMIERLDKIKKLSYIKPQGAFYLFCNISQIKMGSHEFAKKLLDDTKVALIPGKDFGRDDFVRISFATDLESIKKGMDRIEQWVRQ